MKAFAEFQTMGRVGKVNPAGSTLKASIAADYGRRNDRGEWEARPFWNTVTLFNENVVNWARDNIGPGDLVFARGTIRETSYERNGEPVYGITLATEQLDLLAKKQDRD